jgi:hypothetical protein
MEVTKCLKPSGRRVTNYGDSASVQATTCGVPHSSVLIGRCLRTSAPTTGALPGATNGGGVCCRIMRAERGQVSAFGSQVEQPFTTPMHRFQLCVVASRGWLVMSKDAVAACLMPRASIHSFRPQVTGGSGSIDF